MSQSVLYTHTLMLKFHCNVFRKYLEHYIEHMPIETQRKAEKILTICEKRNMSEHGKSQWNFFLDEFYCLSYTLFNDRSIQLSTYF